ncbi:ExbD/TolR family protein [Litoribrevibacter albus]|uniref:Biopolymer transporter ExbD n=1 Tax=Litoribrevibacter albus TaxID=1473156 RepID=A0AA37SDW4_9GAMM|nr:biopolymer transporter ExbD [Litoribrevibacter albus]GLQ32718.1 biopolymer transporter ExbD [Litoribrevibacter albus]
MRSRINLTNEQDDSNIDMTPMLDIVFIMLIFFIVSTTFVKESGVDINRPASSTAQQQDSSGVRLAVTADGLVWLEGKQTDIRMIRPKLERMKVEQPDIAVLLQADEDTKTGVLIRVMDQVKLAGIEQLAVATKNAVQGAH